MLAEKGRSWEFRSETSACVLCVRERICGVAAAVLVAALQLIRGATSRAVLRWCEPLTANILAGRATGRQSYSLRPEVAATAPVQAPVLSTSCGLCC